MFGQRRRLRVVAAQVLLTWLFALGAGIVNACVLEPELRHPVTNASHDQHHSGSGSHHHDTHHSGGHDRPSPHANNAPCAKFCDEPSTGAQTLQPQIDPFHAIGLAAPPVNSLTLDATPPVGRAFAADHEQWRPAIPIRLAFLRLAL